MAADLSLVLGVVTVLAGDLIAEGLLEVHQTDPVEIELDALTRMLEARPQPLKNQRETQTCSTTPPTTSPR